MNVLLILAVLCTFQVSSGRVIHVNATNVQTILDVFYPKFYIETYGFSQGLTYPPNSDTVWRVHKSSTTVTRLTLNFQTFILDGTPGACTTDTFVIRAQTLTQNPYCGTQTGITVPVNFPTPGYVDLEFSSDATIQLRGFSILVTQI